MGNMKRRSQTDNKKTGLAQLDTPGSGVPGGREELETKPL